MTPVVDSVRSASVNGHRKVPFGRHDGRVDIDGFRPAGQITFFFFSPLRLSVP